MTGRVIAIVGMQYGSEGKGQISHLLASLAQVAIRTGGPNAGHTVRHRGSEFKMRQIPCAFVNPSCLLLIGPGGLVNFELLRSEIGQLTDAGFQLAGRLYVHENAGVIGEREIERERTARLRERFGSTSEGVGAATAARSMRDLSLVKDQLEAVPEPATVLTRSTYLELLHSMYLGGATIILEGTQGAGLSLYHGHYPYVTSRDVSTAALAGASGVHPRMVGSVVGVTRTFPIRVGGNSGWLPFETTFEAVGVTPERTTVSNTVRRVAHFDPVAFREAVLLNGPTTIALTFGDYLGKQDVAAWQRQVEVLAGVPVEYLGVAELTDAWKRPGSIFSEAEEAWRPLGGLSTLSAGAIAQVQEVRRVTTTAAGPEPQISQANLKGGV